MEPSSIYQGYRNLIELPRFENPANRRYRKKRNHKLDGLIAQGLTLQEIGDEIGYTRELVRQYILGTSQKEIWDKVCKKYRPGLSKQGRKKIILFRLASQIEEIGRSNVTEEDRWAYEQVIVGTLRSIYPERAGELEKPYVDFVTSV